MNEINENQDGLFIFVSIVGIVLFVALLVHAFDKHKKKDSVLNQHGITVEAEREFQAFMNSCFISCSLPREKRDPLKWDKKNIGKYFSL